MSDKENAKLDAIDQNLRQVGQKTFFRKNNQWQDSTVTDEQSKKAIRVKQFSREYFDLAAKHSGTLAKYIAFDEPVLVNLDDKTYQIDPEEADPLRRRRRRPLRCLQRADQEHSRQ